MKHNSNWNSTDVRLQNSSAENWLSSRIKMSVLQFSRDITLNLMKYLGFADAQRLAHALGQEDEYLNRDTPLTRAFYRVQWKRLRLPDPAKISKPCSWIILIFHVKTCSFCRTNITRKIFWELGGYRICRECQKEQLLRKSLEAYHFLPHTEGSVRHGRYLRQDFGDGHFTLEQQAQWQGKKQRIEEFCQDMIQWSESQ